MANVNLFRGMFPGPFCTFVLTDTTLVRGLEMSLCRLAIFNALYFTKRLCQQIWRFTFRFNEIKFMKVFIAVLWSTRFPFPAVDASQGK